MKRQLRRLREEQGATAVEYGIMVALIAVVIIGVVFALGGTLQETFRTVEDCVANPSADGCESGAGGDEGEGTEEGG